MSCYFLLAWKKFKHARSQKCGQSHREGLATWRFIVTERCVCDAYRSRAGALYCTAVAFWQNVEQRGRPECTRRAAGRIPVICQAALRKQQGMSQCQVVWKWAKRNVIPHNEQEDGEPGLQTSEFRFQAHRTSHPIVHHLHINRRRQAYRFDPVHRTTSTSHRAQ